MADILRSRVRDPPSKALLLLVRSVSHGELVVLGAERGLLAEQNIPVNFLADLLNFENKEYYVIV